MLDFCLHRYRKNEGTNPFNAPHKYRFALKIGLDVTPFLLVWNNGKNEVLKRFTEKINIFIEEGECFGFITPPSNAHIFVDDFCSGILKSFPLAVDFSDCFFKVKPFDAGATKIGLSDQELKEIFKLNVDCYEGKNKQEINSIFILDDVYAIGNTIQGIFLALTEHDKTKKIIKGAILNTNE